MSASLCSAETSPAAPVSVSGSVVAPVVSVVSGADVVAMVVVSVIVVAAVVVVAACVV